MTHRCEPSRNKCAAEANCKFYVTHEPSDSHFEQMKLARNIFWFSSSSLYLAIVSTMDDSSMLFAHTQKKNKWRKQEEEENTYAESAERETAEKRILLLLDKFHCVVSSSANFRLSQINSDSCSVTSNISAWARISRGGNQHSQQFYGSLPNCGARFWICKL